MTTTEKKIALFDFDGTITTKDSFMEFLKFAAGKRKFWTGFLLQSPWMMAFMIGKYPAARMKERVMTYFFKNWELDRFNAKAIEFAEEIVPGLIKSSAMERISWHKENGHEIVVVSASFSNWLIPWCKQMDLKLLSTELEIKNNRITGKLATPNCKGAEKVRRIKECFELSDYTYIYAYGNSSGDKEMLELANEPYMNNFK